MLLVHLLSSFPNVCNHQIVISIPVSSPKRSYIEYTQMPSPTYQNVINLVVRATAQYTHCKFSLTDMCRCSPCFRFYILHIPFTQVSTFFMKHPQCNRHSVAHLQLQRQSVACSTIHYVLGTSLRLGLVLAFFLIPHTTNNYVL
jgi:hypothetical protein